MNGRRAAQLHAADDANALIGHGNDALHKIGDLRAARCWFEQAYLAAERASDVDGMATAALGIGGLWVHEHRDAAAWAQAISWQRRSLAAADASTELAARLRARVAAEEDYRVGRHREVLRALEEARSRDNPRTLAMTLSLAHHCVLGPEHGRLRAALAEELLLTAARTDCRTDRLMGMLWRTANEFLDGDPHAERSLGQLRDALLLGEMHLAVGFVVDAMTVMLKIRTGDLVQAEALATECARRGEACGDPDAAGWYRGQLLAIRWFQGRVGELAPVLNQQVHSSSLGALDDSLVAALAVAAATAGDHLAAAGALARLGRGDLRRVPSSSAWLVTVCAAVEAAARLADADTAATAYDLLQPYAQLPVMASLAVACFGSVQHSLGVAALTMGNPDLAVAHLRLAVRENLMLGHWPAHCLSRHRLAHALCNRGRPLDIDAARVESAAAKRAAAQLSMVLPPPDPAPGTAPRAAPGTNTTRTPARSDDGQRSRRSTVPDVQVRLLGPVDITLRGTTHTVPGVRRKTVLAVLALYAGEVVSTDRLTDIVWGEQVPRTAANTLQSHVSFLRRMIGARAAILARSGGYLLEVGPEATDVAVAERLIRLGTQSADPIDVVRHLNDALALWRGPPLQDIAGAAWTRDHTQRLNILRLTAHKAQVLARLALGQHAQLTAELDPLTPEYQLDEQIHEHLMLALYREGRQSQALRLYERLRAALRHELGIDPSRPLRDLHTAILRQDEALDLAPPRRPSR